MGIASHVPDIACTCVSHVVRILYGGARADAEAVGATTLGATRLGLQHKLELRVVDNLEPLDVAAVQHGGLVALDVGVAERVALDDHLAVYVVSSE